MMNTFSLIFVAAVAVHLTIHLWLSRRQIRYVRDRQDRVPDAFRTQIQPAEHRKAAAYAIARATFGQVELCYGMLILLLWTLGGGLELVDGMWRNLELSPIAAGVGVMLSVFALVGLLDIPTDLYQTFVIEQRFGFNRTTFKVFVTDLLKQAVLLIAIGAPLAAFVLWIMDNAGPLWWLYVWLTWLGFGLLMTWAYPIVIAPLFNKFRPLNDNALRERIESLLRRSGFSSQGIFVMDGSARSSHGNAYFTGFGANKRIVFFDTLLKELDPSEIESVLAHELGHFKRKHVLKKMVMMAGISLAGLGLLGWLIGQPWFYAGLGVSQPSVHMAMLLFLMVSPVFSVFLQPIMTFVSRKYEFEADEYACQQADAKSLVHALVKLYKENATTLTPDPLYSAFHDSHPPAPVRVAHLAAKYS